MISIYEELLRILLKSKDNLELMNPQLPVDVLFDGIIRC